MFVIVNLLIACEAGFNNNDISGNKQNTLIKILEIFVENHESPAWKSKFYCDNINTSRIDFIGEFKTRIVDLQTISQKMGIDLDSKVPLRKTERGMEYRTHFDDHTWQMIYEMFELDITEYNYCF